MLPLIFMAQAIVYLLLTARRTTKYAKMRDYFFL